MSRRGENIYKRKDGRYEGRYVIERFPNGKCHFGYLYGYHYQEVRRALILRKATIYQAEGASIPQKRVTAADWMNYWLYHEVQPYVRKSTFRNYHNHVENYFLPEFGIRPLDDIKHDDLQNFADKLAQKLAPSTVCSVFGTLRSCLRAACSRGVLEKNPFYNIHLPKNTFRQPRVLTKAEQQLMEKKILESGQIEFLLCLYMGLRLGEVCALQWRDIDLKSGMLHVRHTVQRVSSDEADGKTKVVVTKPKTERSVRDIPIPSFLIGLLEERMKGEKEPEGFVFGADSSQPMETRTMQMRFTAFCEELGLEGVHMHTLRHTFATRCLEQQIGIEVLSELLGHSSPKITMECYAHCTEETKRYFMESIGPIGEK